jgi:ATP adenylyltransferase
MTDLIHQTETGRRALIPGQLRTWLRQVSASALESGALRSFETACERVQDDGLTFLVRQLANLQRKQQATVDQQRAPKPRNPFLPYEPDLYVADLGDRHLCLLNKFNVLDDHLLIITRDYASQDDWLTAADFRALAMALGEFDGFVFYNGGTLAGASQPHKHLQLIPFDAFAPGTELPLLEWLDQDDGWSASGTLGRLPYRHAVAPLSPDWSDADGAAASLDQVYAQLLDACGLPRSGTRALAPYNLLAARDWMMVVPRRREDCLGISVNSLGFAGALLVRDADQGEQLRQLGPLQLLTEVAIAR